MIENTYDNCHKLAELSANSTDLDSLIQFYQVSLFERMMADKKVFEDELENMDIETQEELDGDE